MEAKVNSPKIVNQSVELDGVSIPDHPRLLFTNEREAEIKELAKHDTFLDSLLNFLKEEADELLEDRPMEYPAHVSSILPVSREQIYRIMTLSLAYRMFGEAKYAEKAKAGLINVCNYPDWGPKHYLDVAEMSTAVAISYDWLYDFLPYDTRRLIAKSIKERALMPALKEYETGSHVWGKRETNWNVVCNTGMVLAALAVAEDEPAMAGKIIKEGVGNVPLCLKYFGPDGVCYEGPGYWYYTTVNLAMLISCLDENLKTDFGLSGLSGIDRTAFYYVSSVSPSGLIFNFADTYRDVPNYGPCYFFFSRKYNLPRVAEFYRNLIREVILSPKKNPRWHFFLNIPWYDPSTASVSTEVPRMQVFNNQLNPILVFRGNGKDANAISLMAKGGAGDMPHQHLDAGSFVVETNGVRWLVDLGVEPSDYSLDGFWDYTPYTGERWSYFRYNNFSHNTLSLNGTLQNSAGRGRVLRFCADAGKPFGIIDLTSVYSNLASRVQRGFMLMSDNAILVQDEVSALSDSCRIVWNSVTDAEITIKGNTAILRKGTSKFILKIAAPYDAVFTKSAISNYGPAAPIIGYSLLQVSLSTDEDTPCTIRILMGSDEYGMAKAEAGNINIHLANWR
ncbi:MAG: heparinase II/III-family protein [Bacteroidales bacterium]|nr:heparinase II/III-family protein [Bacteroidales bacterium]MCI2145176.1 heparinase II/III-family protein [Bacteroidales bacterium]